MLSISLAAQNKLAENANVIAKATLTLANGNTVQLTGDDFMFGSMSFSEATSSDSSFDIGSCIMGSFEVTLNNFEGKFENYDFTGATITPYVGIELEDTTEWILKGEYGVDQPSSYGATIRLSCLDNMRLFERDYGTVRTSYPTTLRTIVLDICEACGVDVAQASFENDETVVQERPEGEWSCIAMLGYAVQASGNFAKFDPYGRLTIHWYSIPDGESDLDGGSFDTATPFSTGDRADGGDFLDYSSGYVADGGTFDQGDYVNLYALSSSEIVTDDVVITGIQVTSADYTYEPAEGEEIDPDGPQAGDTIEGETVLSGVPGYVLVIDDNPLIQHDIVREVANNIAERTIGMQFRPFSCEAISNPSVEAGDPCSIIDRLGNQYKSYVTSLVYTLGSYESYRCGALTPARNSAGGFTAATKIIKELENGIIKEKTNRERAIEQLNKILEESAGLYTTRVTLDDGSTVIYMHDKPTLEGSTVVWKMTADAIGVSTDGGNTYLTGLTADGMAILNRIYTIGLNADYINTGALVVKKNGTTMFSADVDTGQVYMSGDAITIESQSLPNAIKSANAHYGYCSTAANVTAKTVTCENFKLYKGATVVVKFAYKNTASSPTMNVNGTGAKAIRIYGSDIAAQYYWGAYDTLTFVYDGSYWNISDAGALSKIKQTENSITLSVANTYATIASVQGTYATKSELTVATDKITSTVAEYSTAYGTCSTAAATTAKVVTCSNFKLRAGATIAVKFTNSNTAKEPTMNVNNTGAAPLYVGSNRPTGTYSWKAGDVVTFVYSGSYWYMSDCGSYSKIEQFADSISLSVTNGSLGKTASIVLSANGSTQTSTINMSGVRKAFQNDTTKITITSGIVTFNSNTFIVNSSYFSVTANGTITATAGTIGGFTIASNNLHSSYMQINSNGYICYGTTGNFYVYDGTYSSPGSKLMQLGINTWAGTSKKGITVGAGYNCWYVGFAYQEKASASTFTAKFFYATADFNGYTGSALHACCQLYMHGNWINSPSLYDVRVWSGSGTTNYTTVTKVVTFPIVMKTISSDLKSMTWINNCQLSFRYGLLISANF